MKQKSGGGGGGVKELTFKRIAVLGYLTQLKKGLGLAFGADFLHDFSVKMFLI